MVRRSPPQVPQRRNCILAWRGSERRVDDRTDNWEPDLGRVDGTAGTGHPSDASDCPPDLQPGACEVKCPRRHLRPRFRVGDTRLKGTGVSPLSEADELTGFCWESGPVHRESQLIWEVQLVTPDHKFWVRHSYPASYCVKTVRSLSESEWARLTTVLNFPEGHYQIGQVRLHRSWLNRLTLGLLG